MREVHNYVCALDYGLERSKTLPVSLRLVREMHGVLMEGVGGEYLTPGEFRRSQNWIGTPGSTLESATMVPPPVDEMHPALDALEEFIHTHSELPHLVRAGLIHYQFEAIHPFLDGNGRVGRLLVILLLVEWGLISRPLLSLSAFFEAQRQEYYERLLAVSQRGEWENWYLFFLKGISSQSLDAIARIERLGRLRAAYQERLRAERAAERLLRVLDVLFERPILNIRLSGANPHGPLQTLLAVVCSGLVAGTRTGPQPTPAPGSGLLVVAQHEWLGDLVREKAQNDQAVPTIGEVSIVSSHREPTGIPWDVVKAGLYQNACNHRFNNSLSRPLISDWDSAISPIFDLISSSNACLSSDTPLRSTRMIKIPTSSGAVRIKAINMAFRRRTSQLAK